MKQKHHPRTLGHALGLGIAGVAFATGCASGGSPRHEPAASSYDNLTTDLSICQKAHQVCAEEIADLRHWLGERLSQRAA